MSYGTQGQPYRAFMFLLLSFALRYLCLSAYTSTRPFLSMGLGTTVGSALGCLTQNCGFGHRPRTLIMLGSQTLLALTVCHEGRYVVAAVCQTFGWPSRTLMCAKLLALLPCGVSHGHSCFVTLSPINQLFSRFLTFSSLTYTFALCLSVIR